MTNFTLPTDFSNLLGQGLLYQDACEFAFSQFKFLTLQSAATLGMAQLAVFGMLALAVVVIILFREVKLLRKSVEELVAGAPEKRQTGAEPPLVVSESGKYLNDVNV